ncbi:MAG: glycosyltransferase family 2 protein [Solirubrobacteraceae bacterium]
MMLARLRRAVDWRMRALSSRLDSLQDGLRTLEQRIEELAGETSVIRAQLEDGVQPVLRAILDEEAQNRRRLYALRGERAYEEAYSDPSPLVSITLATHNRPELLVERALPSLLAQSYTNLEIVVLGDGAPPEVEAAVRGLGDERVHYASLTQRINAHDDQRRHWLVGSTMARNEATRRARGAWLLHFDDDDGLRPDAIASLLALAREQRAEVAYGGFEEHGPDGANVVKLAPSPEPGSFGWQGALVHGGLRFFERELVAASLGVPGDAYLLERMLRVGVRFAMLDEVVWDYFPSTLWTRSSVSQTVAQTSSTTAGSSSE